MKTTQPYTVPAANYLLWPDPNSEYHAAVQRVLENQVVATACIGCVPCLSGLLQDLLASRGMAVPDLQVVLDKILEARASTPAKRSVLVAITGIDGSGKGYLAAQIVEALLARGVRAAGINIDGWLNLPHRRFHRSSPAEHFYLHAIRFDEMFAQLILPLRDHRSLRLEVDYAEETATEYRRHIYEFEDIDVIVLEGIYLLKRSFQAYYDVSFWIDCSFDTALDRAIARAQEALPPEATVSSYRTIYFPAQEIHFQRDNPRAAATMIVDNDPKLRSVQSPSRPDEPAG